MKKARYARRSRDYDHFTSVDEAKPAPFVLVMLVDSSGRLAPGWWEGARWFCRKKFKLKEVVAWKPFRQERD